MNKSWWNFAGKNASFSNFIMRRGRTVGGLIGTGVAGLGLWATAPMFSGHDPEKTKKFRSSIPRTMAIGFGINSYFAKRETGRWFS